MLSEPPLIAPTLQKQSENLPAKFGVSARRPEAPPATAAEPATAATAARNAAATTEQVLALLAEMLRATVDAVRASVLQGPWPRG
jgi:hypothetical protein